jgi:hypothetical protein
MNRKGYQRRRSWPDRDTIPEFVLKQWIHHQPVSQRKLVTSAFRTRVPSVAAASASACSKFIYTLIITNSKPFGGIRKLSDRMTYSKDGHSPYSVPYIKVIQMILLLFQLFFHTILHRKVSGSWFAFSLILFSLVSKSHFFSRHLPVRNVRLHGNFILSLIRNHRINTYDELEVQLHAFLTSAPL